MTATSKSSFYTDVTWSSKTLNLSISRFFSTIKTGLGPSPSLGGFRLSRNKHTTSSPLLTWDHFRDHFNLIGPDNNQAKQEKDQLRLLKEVISSIEQNPFEATAGLQPIPSQQSVAPGAHNEKIRMPKKRNKLDQPGLLQSLSYRMVVDFKKDFYKVPPPIYIKLPYVSSQHSDDAVLNLISMRIGKLPKIPPWEQYKRIVPSSEVKLFDVYKDLEKMVIDFQERYENARINFLPICEFIRTKQLNTRVFIKQCQRLSEETQLLGKRLDQFHVDAYDNFLNNTSSQKESYTISVAERNYAILMEMLFDLQRASPLCEDRLSLCNEALSRVKSALVAGETTFQEFQKVHGKYVRYDTFLEKYFWKLWWHFDIIQQELYGGGVREAFEQHQKVISQSIAETYEGKMLISMAESKLRSLHLLMRQIERMHQSRMSAQNALQRLAGQ